MKSLLVKSSNLKFVGLNTAKSTLFMGILAVISITTPVNAQNFKKIYQSNNYTALEINQSSTSVTKILSPKLTILPMGINVGGNNIIPSVTVKGLENGREAVDFNNWLIPFSSVVQALKFDVTKNNDGQIELHSIGLKIKFDPNILVNDPDIGQAISVEQIRDIFKTTTEFNIAEYAIVLTPPWLTKSVGDRQYQEKEPPIILKGLPQIDAPFFRFSGISQKINLNQLQGKTIIDNNLKHDSEFNLLGSISGGSLFSKIQQLNTSNNWKLSELQYFYPSPYTDYIIGSQAPFWRRLDHNQGDFFGFTLIQRDYIPPNNGSFSYGGFNPQQRLNTNEVVRTITGKAAPGTLVQLVTQNSNLIFREQLVDDSGKYRFEKVAIGANSFTGTGGSLNYKLRLYPGGNLSAKPEEISLNYRNIQNQINQGKSAFIISAGTERNIANESFFGNIGSFKGGGSYYFGLSDEITLGTGIAYNNSIKPYTEILYQPVNSPLTFRAGTLIGKQINFNADISYRINNFSLRFGGDEKSYNSNLYWNLNRQFSLFSNWSYSGVNNRLETGFNLNLRPVSLSLTYDTNNVINGFLRARFDPFTISARKYNQQLSSELIYNLSSKHSFSSTGNAIRLTYESDDKNYLGSLNWIYPSPFKDKNGRSLLNLEFGYGIGSHGNGIITSASTTILPGLGLRLTYREVGLSDNNSSLSLNFFSSLLLQPSMNFSSDETKLEKLRTQGGIFLQPFLDKNNNGRRDHGEDFYTEDIESLFLINNLPLNKLGVSRPNIVKNGALFELPPDNYRLDIDPAGFPPGWKAVQSAYAVRVAPGTYTTVSIPLIPSYVVTGRVLNPEGKPLTGVKVEFVSRSHPEKIVTSVTNSAGIYYLEDLNIDIYNVFINGNPSQPNTWEINADSKTFLELNLNP